MFGKLEIIVSKDMMTAEAVIREEGEDIIDKEFIEATLAEMEIKAGVKHIVIEKMIDEQEYDKHYVIAEGRPSLPGRNGYYTYNFDVEKKEYKPVVQEDGSVDYVRQRELVKKGDLLAEYHPAKQGTFGYTIFANVLAAVPVKDLPRLHVSQVDKLDDKYFAATNGEPSLKGDTLAVEDLLVFDGNATNVQGPIIYTGDVQVKGDVISGTTIIADGNVIVYGIVEAAQIEAGKDIVIKGGIHGQERAMIKAKGSVMSPYIEEATVVAGDKVTFNYAYCSTIISNKDVLVDGRIGQVIGGSITAKNSITVKIAGNMAEVATKLQIVPKDGEIDQQCAIVIEKEAYPGTIVSFGEVSIPAKEKRLEYHFANGIINSCMVGEYIAEEIKKLEPRAEKPVVLLVDDEPIILKTFYSYLCSDYTVKAVSSAKDAFTLMENMLPDLILLDYNMPGMDGGEMLETMRKNTWKWYTNVPVIFATAVTDKSVVMKVLSLYPQGYLTKPLGKQELLDVVNKFFASNRG